MRALGWRSLVLIVAVGFSAAATFALADPSPPPASGDASVNYIPKDFTDKLTNQDYTNASR